MVLGPSYFFRECRTIVSCFFLFFVFFCSILWCTREKEKEKGTHPHSRRVSVALPMGRRNNSSHPMASASAPANELAKQLPASASSLAVPPPAASTAEALDLSAGATIRGLLLLLLLLLLLRRVQASSPAKMLNAGVTCISFSFYYRIRLWSTCSCLFAF